MKSNLDHQDMRRFAELLKTLMPPNWAFTLFTFETNTPAAEVFYISSADRESMRGTIQTMLDKWKAMDDFKEPNPN